MCRKALCTAAEFIASFPCVADSFFYFGAADMSDILSREAEIAKKRPAHAPDEAPPCDGSGPPRYLVFDTETSGDSGPQLAIQLAFIVYDDLHRELFKLDKYLMLPPSRTISYVAQRIHKISNGFLSEHGTHPVPELTVFFEWVDRVFQAGGSIVSHNAAFDSRVVTNTAKEWGLARELDASDCFCTMQEAKRHCGLTNKRGAPKPPKNIELYRALFSGSEPNVGRLHDALNDVRVTAASFKAGAERGWWRA